MTYISNGGITPEVWVFVDRNPTIDVDRLDPHQVALKLGDPTWPLRLVVDEDALSALERLLKQARDEFASTA
ncbi:hypothetical protein [Actinokineospora cianjurensis]|uniref:Uncharacterized protein n=1 Tax=Actinokineospora cianjurensis TaxID=585224 RepID=A0A421B5E3_9PSEU|nr:hypothetical protein [Actinokineospora cianjurensis]RLK59682.1 hypothetical protein CLV68_0166 [Actinokineospora cianjurensis]